MEKAKRAYSVVVRVYTPKREEVVERVDRAMGHAQHFLKVRKQFPALSRLVLLVPNDYDCGDTLGALLERLSAKGLFGNVVPYGPLGHHSCEVLNFGMSAAAKDSSHALIVSGKAMSYLTVPVMRAIDEAFTNGAKAVGIAADELKELVLVGRIQNTFAAWELDALNKVGNFDSKTGVEEIAPLVRLVREFGKCIAPINVVTGKLDVLSSETALARHREVMTTKLARQQDELARVNSCFSEITAGIMPDYPLSI